LRDNQLSSFPDEVEQLVELRILNLSANKLRAVPVGLTRLRGLAQLNLSNNELRSLDGDWSGMVNLDTMHNILSRLYVAFSVTDLSDNRLCSFPDRFPPHVRRLSLNNNRLDELPAGFLDQVPGLQSLDISSNALKELVLLDTSHGASYEYQLVTLRGGFNRLIELPFLVGLKSLKELYLGDNRIAKIELEKLSGCPLITLELARNKIITLPDGMAAAFPDLVRLDISANELSVYVHRVLGLPTELGFMNRLQVLLVERNPLRSIRQNVISGGTDALKALLRQRHNPDLAGPQTAPGTKSLESSSAHKSEVQQSEPTSQSSEVPSSVLASVTKTLDSVMQNVEYPPAPKASGTDSQKIKPFVASKLPGPTLPVVNQAGLLDWSEESRGQADKPVIPLPDLDSVEAWLSAANTSQTARVSVRSLLLSRRKLTTVPIGSAFK
uniref:Leucine-rich repeat-containing protein 40 n=1 Tax=Echinostoma caproni TaxID=27848 RepID=A0A183AKC5_9TREM